MTASHEDLYRRTIDTFTESVERHSFTDAAIPRLVEGLRAELGQCMELELISAEFYAERMAILQSVIGVLV